MDNAQEFSDRFVFDEIGYKGAYWLTGFEDPIRNQKEAYPIISLGNMTSSNLKEGQFVFTRPSYYEGGLGERNKHRTEYKYYHDHLYLSFKLWIIYNTTIVAGTFIPDGGFLTA